MNEALFKKYGIDPGLPTEQILEQLQSKNLELLERMGSCSDNARLAQLQTDQREVEDAISTLSSAVSLDRQVAKKAAQPSPAASADPLQAALQDYQAGKIGAALPVLREHADQGDTLCCILTANILMNQHQTQEGKEYLYAASAAGSGAASLMLAQTYQHDNVLPSAIKWGKVALEQKEKGSGRFLAPLYLKNGQPDQAAEAYISELALVSQYDLYLLTYDIVALLNRGKLSPAAAKRLREETLVKIQNDSRCMDCWQKQMCAQQQERREERKERIEQFSWRIAFGAFGGGLVLVLLLKNWVGLGIASALCIAGVTLYRSQISLGADRIHTLVNGGIKAAIALIAFPLAFHVLVGPYTTEGDVSDKVLIMIALYAAQVIGTRFLLR